MAAALPRSTIIATALTLIAIAVAVLIPTRGAEPAPAGFPLWRLHAGGSFAELEQRLWLEQRRKFACKPIVGPHRLCAVRSSGLPTTGVPGAVLALVDSTGRIASVQFRAALDTSRMVVQARRIVGDWYRDIDSLEARWDSVAAVADSSRVVARSAWATPDGRYSAWLVRDSLTGHRSALTVADERGLALIRGSADLSKLVLEVAGLDRVGSGGLWRGPVGPLAALGPSMPRRAVQVCPAQFRQPRLREDSTKDVLPAYLRLLDQSIRLAYPGATLISAEDGLFLMRNGVPERLLAEPAARSDDRELQVYAIRLPDRAGMAAVRDIPGQAANCRAPTELLLVRVDTSESATETYRLVIDDEAVVTRITELETLDAVGLDAGVAVEYVATYDTVDWVAEVVWVAVLHLREPRVLARTPSVIEKRMKSTGEKRVAEISVRRSSPDSVRVSFLEPAPATKTVVVAHRRGEPFDTYALLARY